jgi:RimJ/RimL family protein N-acetyltransferase
MVWACAKISAPKATRLCSFVLLQLSGDKVKLRPLRADEFTPLYEARKESSADVESINVERLRARVAHSGDWFEGHLDLAIEAHGDLVGTIDARAPRGFAPHGVCELGIELFGDERGKGVGTEAVRLVTDWLLGNGYPRVQASTDLRNGPMRRVLEKLGFEQEGVMRRFMPDGDARVDYALYAITRP